MFVIRREWATHLALFGCLSTAKRSAEINWLHRIVITLKLSLSLRGLITVHTVNMHCYYSWAYMQGLYMQGLPINSDDNTAKMCNKHSGNKECGPVLTDQHHDGGSSHLLLLLKVSVQTLLWKGNVLCSSCHNYEGCFLHSSDKSCILPASTSSLA